MQQATEYTERLHALFANLARLLNRDTEFLKVCVRECWSVRERQSV